MIGFVLFWSYYIAPHLEISTSTPAVALASALEKCYFCVKKTFVKKKFYVEYTSIFFLVLSCSASVSFYMNVSFLYEFLYLYETSTPANIQLESFLSTLAGLAISFSRCLNYFIL